jgi:BolA protein
MSVKKAMTAKLAAALAPLSLDVIDESHQHAGHAGWNAAGETHFRVKIVSAKFAGMSRVERHRTVHGLLAEELKTGVHALAIEARAPTE